MHSRTLCRSVPVSLSLSVCLGAGRVRVKLKKDFHFHFSPSPTSARSKKKKRSASLKTGKKSSCRAVTSKVHAHSDTHTLVEARAKQIHETNPRSSHLHVKPAAEQPPNQAAAQSLSRPRPRPRPWPQSRSLCAVCHSKDSSRAATEAATAAGLSKPKSQSQARLASRASHHFACPEGAVQRERERKRER